MHLPFMQDNIIQALGWTFVHSLWQGLLLAIIAGLIVLLTRKSSAGTRYNLLVGLFCLFLGATVVTFISQLHSAPAASGATATFIPSAPPQAVDDYNVLSPVLNVDAQEANHFTDRFVNYFNTHAPMVVLVWFIIFSARLVKLLANLGYVQRIKHYKTHAAPGAWTRRLRLMAQGLHIRQKIQLLESGIVKVPVVVGFLKPVILIPIGLIAHLPAEQVEAILLHELAHIKRKDYFVNLLQSFAETVFFFNPALLWLSSLLREERENCCDDIAVAGTGNKTAFLDALVSFQEYTSSAAGFEMAFPGRKNYLLNRVKRILHQKNKTLNTMEKSLLTFSIALILLLTLTTARQAQAQTDTIPPAAKQVMPPPPPPAMMDNAASPVAPAAPVRRSSHASRATGNTNETPGLPAIAPVPPTPPMVAISIQPTVAISVRPEVNVAPVAPPTPASKAMTMPRPVVAPVPPVPLRDTLRPIVLRLDTLQPIINEFPHLSTNINDDGTTKTETIDATDRNGVVYKLSKVNDAITFLSVNGVEVPKDQYAQYQQVIDRLGMQRLFNHKRSLDLRYNLNYKTNLKLQSDIRLQNNIQLRKQIRTEAVRSIQLEKQSAYRSYHKIAPVRTIQLERKYAYRNDQKTVPLKIIPSYEYKKGLFINKHYATAHLFRKTELDPARRTGIRVIRGKSLFTRNDNDNIQLQKRLMRDLISDLRKENIIKDMGDLVWVGLTDNEFIVNGIKQSTETWERYKTKYLIHPGMGLFYGPVKMSGTGFFIDKGDL